MADPRDAHPAPGPGRAAHPGAPHAPTASRPSVAGRAHAPSSPRRLARCSTRGASAACSETATAASASPRTASFSPTPCSSSCFSGRIGAMTAGRHLDERSRQVLLAVIAEYVESARAGRLALGGAPAHARPLPGHHPQRHGRSRGDGLSGAAPHLRRPRAHRQGLPLLRRSPRARAVGRGQGARDAASARPAARPDAARAAHGRDPRPALVGHAHDGRSSSRRRSSRPRWTASSWCRWARGGRSRWW